MGQASFSRSGSKRRTQPKRPAPGATAGSSSSAAPKSLHATTLQKTEGPAPPLAVAPFDATQARQHQEAWAKYLGVPVETTNSIGMKLVLIPPGEFEMGSTEKEIEQCSNEFKNGKVAWGASFLSRERPQHHFRIAAPFYAGEYEVTVAQFRKFAEATRYKTEAERDGKGGYSLLADGREVQSPQFVWSADLSFLQTDACPVTIVTWNDATAFCKWLSEATGETYRLPTEHEWEYACRAGTTTPWSSGDDPQTLKLVANVADKSFQNKYPKQERASGPIAWDDGYPCLAPVGKFQPNAFGLYDMHGNVWEWCADRYHPHAYKRYQRGDFSPPSEGSHRVLRGGSWFDHHPGFFRSAFRLDWPADTRTFNFGFRVVRKVGIPSAKPRGETASWPQFHGPRRDNISTETGLPKRWPKEGPKLLWTAKGIGHGFSSLAVAQGLIYTAGNIGGQTVITALDKDGRIQWQTEDGKAWEKDTPGTRATPTLDGDRLYYESPLGEVVCLDARSGRKIWGLNILEKFGATNIQWGLCESLLIDGDRVICAPGGPQTAVVALDKRTGQVVWKSPSVNEPAGYASPTLGEYQGLRMIFTATARAIIAVNADNGDLLWKFNHPALYDENILMPIFHEGQLFYSSLAIGSVMLRIKVDGKKAAVEEVWRSKSLDNQHGGVLLLDGYLYGTLALGKSGKWWACLDWKTGQQKYLVPGLGKGSLTGAEGMLYTLNENRTVGLVAAKPSAHDVISQFKIPAGGEGPTWAHPVICGGRLYVRHGDRLYAFDLRAENPGGDGVSSERPKNEPPRAVPPSTPPRPASTKRLGRSISASPSKLPTRSGWSSESHNCIRWLLAHPRWLVRCLCNMTIHAAA